MRKLDGGSKALTDAEHAVVSGSFTSFMKEFKDKRLAITSGDATGGEKHLMQSSVVKMTPKMEDMRTEMSASAEKLSKDLMAS